MRRAQFTEAMAVMYAMDDLATADDAGSGDELVVLESEEASVAGLMLASGVYDPSHAFPEAMRFDAAGRQRLSLPALRAGYRTLCCVEGNVSLSDRHQAVVGRVLRCMGWAPATVRRRMPYTARQLRAALAGIPEVAGPALAAEQAARDGELVSEPGGKTSEEQLEERLQAVELPEDDQARVDQVCSAWAGNFWVAIMVQVGAYIRACFGGSCVLSGFNARRDKPRMLGFWPDHARTLCSSDHVSGAGSGCWQVWVGSELSTAYTQ